MNDSLLYESDKEIDYFKYGNDILNDSNLSDEEKENIIKDSYYQLNRNLELINSIILINDIEKDDYENIYNKRKLKINYDCINLTKSLLFNESINSNNIHKFIPLLLEHKLIINHFNFYDFYLELIDYAKNEQFEYEDLDDCNKVNADVLDEYLFQLFNNDKLSITADRRIIKNYFDNDKINSLYKSAIENQNYKMIYCCEKYFKKVNSETLNSEVKEKIVDSNKKRVQLKN